MRQYDKFNSSIGTTRLSALRLNLCARLLMVLGRHGIPDDDSLTEYVDGLEQSINTRYPEGLPTLLEMQPFIDEQLDSLSSSLDEAAHGRVDHGYFDFEDTQVPLPAEPGGTPEIVESQPKPVRRQSSTRHTVEAVGLDEKLKQQREPIQRLLEEDCVRSGLVNAKQGRRLARSMFGKNPVEAELEIVKGLQQTVLEELRKWMQQQNGKQPWTTPKAQNALRNDVLSTRSVQSLLRMVSQIRNEARAGSMPKQGWRRLLPKRRGIFG